MANVNLSSAKSAKNDEFYTQFADIEKEMNAYLEFDPDVFRGKTVLLPCDDPEWSNFTRYFAQNFERLGLRKLISTSYAPRISQYKPVEQPTLFESLSPQFDAGKSDANGKIFTLTSDRTGDGKIDVDDLEWDYLQGDGDFRSEEVTRLRDEADIVITNPPFSLFREFLAWVLEAGNQFVILGNMNAVTYKEVFPLLQEDKVWIGVTRTGVGSMWFLVGDDAPSKSGQRVENGQRYQTVGNSAWFTNLDHGRRHQPLALMTQADNKKFSKHKEVKGVGYRRYDNYDAIEVPFTDAIPSDYPGLMGVPISFLSKYNPQQFEILGITKTWNDGAGLKTKTYPAQTQVSAGGVESVVGKLNDGAAIKVKTAPDATHYKVKKAILVQVYARILIKHRSPST
jgi:hypothetical protein